MSNRNIGSEKSGVDLDQLEVKDRPRVLVIDDEPDTVILLKHIFLREGFDVSGAFSGKDAISKIPEIKPSLILLDLMMPEMDGWETFQNIQSLTDIPVIVISALGQTDSVVKALKMGVDDYISKPFDHTEVIARSQAVLRRAGPKKAVNRLGFPDIDLIVDLETQEIYYKGQRIQLTGKMFEVLVMLAHGAPHLVSYKDIAMEIWGENNTSIRNRLKYLVYLLRQEFSRVDPETEVIKNVDRLGYKLLTEK